MKKLFLASSFRDLIVDNDLKTEFINFLPRDPQEIVVYHIPNAADPKEDKSYVSNSVEQLKSLGMRVNDLDLREENYQSLKNKLSKCDAIFVNGGNTFYLLDIVRKSGFSKLLPELLDSGIVYFSASAGSYIACPSIVMSTWKRVGDNVINLEDLTGLNLVPFLMSAHYNREKYYEAVTNGASTTNLPVVALTDQQAIVVVDNKYRVVGEGERIFFNGFKENI